MNVDEAIKQLSFHKLPTAMKLRQVVREKKKTHRTFDRFSFSDFSRSSRNGRQRTQRRVQIESLGLSVSKNETSRKTKRTEHFPLRLISFSAQSYTKRALIVKGLRRRPKYNYAQLKYRYFHYLLRLEEGPAPGKEGLYGPKYPELNDRIRKRLDQLNDRKLLGTIS